MQGNRRTDTGPERRLRSELHHRGLRFRKDLPIELPGGRVRPDVVFTRSRVAIFIDGCFWHRCPTHGTLPKTNLAFWLPKLEANVRRDRRNDELLQTAGWIVIRIWEHEDASSAATAIAAVLGAGPADSSRAD